jgi:outer membrane beta-barrel protein
MYPIKLFICMMLLMSAQALAASATPTPSQEPSPDGEAVDVSKVTQKYWAQGKDTELGVVQNRKYTSEHRLELMLFTGTISTDPFLSVHQYGGSLGYYFNQYFSAHVVAYKDSVSNSDAYTEFKQQTSNASVDLNRPKSFYGVELNENFLYGKASLLGTAIIYVDIFALGGAGITDTESGNDFTGFIGIGQKVHLNKYMAIDLDYRVLFFNEVVESATGGPSHSRSNTTDAITLGLSFLY